MADRPLATNGSVGTVAVYCLCVSFYQRSGLAPGSRQERVQEKKKGKRQKQKTGRAETRGSQGPASGPVSWATKPSVLEERQDLSVAAGATD